MSVNIRPLHDRVIIKKIEQLTTTSGIVIPDSAGGKPSRGKIIAAGPGKSATNGEVQKLDVKVGDEVLFGQYSGTEIKIEDENYLVMSEQDIMAVVEG